MSNPLNDLVTAGEKISTIVSGIKFAYSKAREVRLQQFVRSCDYAFQNSKDPQKKLEFADIFNNDFSTDHAFDFLDGVLKCYSKLARTAIGYLYVKCQSRGAKYLTRDEVIILRALIDLDDVDAQNFLFLMETGDSYSTNTKANDILTRAGKTHWLYLDHNFYDDQSDKFRDMGLPSEVHLKNSLEYFFVKRVLIANHGLAGGRLIDVGIPDVAREFYSILKWSNDMQDIISSKS